MTGHSCQRARPFRIHTCLAQSPLEGSDPAAEFVLRNHENAEIGRAPLEQLTSRLLKPLPEDLLVSHWRNNALSKVVLSWGEVSEATCTLHLGSVVARSLKAPTAEEVNDLTSKTHPFPHGGCPASAPSHPTLT